MSLYAIILNEPSDDAWRRVRKEWEHHQIVDERLAIIKDDNALTKDVASKVGMDPERGTLGIVIQMDYFFGRTATSLVEWINKARE